MSAVDIRQLDGVAEAVGQSRNLVVVVTHGCTNLPFPFRMVDDNRISIEIETTVGESTLVGPIPLHTRHVVKLLEGKQVGGLIPEEVEASRDAVFEEHTLQGHVPPCGGLPLDGTVFNVVKVETYRVVCHLHALPVSAGGIVVEVVITALVEAGCQLKVVDGSIGIGEPLLVCDKPAQLYGGEDTPADACQFDARLGVLAKTAT